MISVLGFLTRKALDPCEFLALSTHPASSGEQASKHRIVLLLRFQLFYAFLFSFCVLFGYPGVDEKISILEGEGEEYTVLGDAMY